MPFLLSNISPHTPLNKKCQAAYEGTSRLFIENAASIYFSLFFEMTIYIVENSDSETDAGKSR